MELPAMTQLLLDDEDENEKNLNDTFRPVSDLE